jgi:UPF0716 protein FxsA
MPLALAFLILPLVEIALFIVIGGRIGLWPTLALIVLSGIIGITILQSRKLRAAQALSAGLRGISVGTFLAQGAFQIAGAVLLIVPGFLSDTIGILLLLPPVQRAIMRRIRSRVVVHEAHIRRRHDPDGEIIEGEFRRGDEPEPPNRIDRKD